MIEQCSHLTQSKLALIYSYEKCKILLLQDISKGFTYEEQDALESFSSRLARTSDISVTKVLKTIQLYESETIGTIRDLLLQSEKKSIISDSSILLEIRLFRNEIAHDYLPKSELAIANTCLEYTPKLLENVNETLKYCQKYIAKS